MFFCPADPWQDHRTDHVHKPASGVGFLANATSSCKLAALTQPKARRGNRGFSTHPPNGLRHNNLYVIDHFISVCLLANSKPFLMAPGNLLYTASIGRVLIPGNIRCHAKYRYYIVIAYESNIVKFDGWEDHPKA